MTAKEHIKERLEMTTTIPFLSSEDILLVFFIVSQNMERECLQVFSSWCDRQAACFESHHVAAIQTREEDVYSSIVLWFLESDD